jgi:hypothetical protein
MKTTQILVLLSALFLFGGCIQLPLPSASMPATKEVSITSKGGKTYIVNIPAPTERSALRFTDVYRQAYMVGYVARWNDRAYFNAGLTQTDKAKFTDAVFPSPTTNDPASKDDDVYLADIMNARELGRSAGELAGLVGFKSEFGVN